MNLVFLFCSFLKKNFKLKKHRAVNADVFSVKSSHLNQLPRKLLVTAAA